MTAEPASLKMVGDLAANLAAHAANVIRKGFHTGVGRTSYKGIGASDPVTDVDVAIERHVREQVAAAFPDHGVVGEEMPDRTGHSEWTWVIDPVDGTRNFVLGIPVLACSIGVLHQGRPVAAAVALPLSDVLVTARLGQGTWWNGVRVRVSNRSADDGSVGVYGHDTYLMLTVDSLDPLRLGESRWFGSTAWELAMIAGGRLDHGVFPATAVWDVAAGVLLVLEAGGQVLELNAEGKAWTPFVSFGAGSDLSHWCTPILCGGKSVDLISERLRPSPTGN